MLEQEHIESYMTLLVDFYSLYSNFTQAIIGNEFLDSQNFTEFPLWKNEMALLLFTIGYFILTYAILRTMKKER